MNKNCKNCWIVFEISQDDLDFYDKISPVFNWRKYKIPSPSFCPDCRRQRRFMFRNFFSIYKRKCNLTQNDIIAAHDESSPFPVYQLDQWWSDKWDWMEYWIELNFDKSFFKQLKLLHDTVPRMNLMNAQCENTNYCNMSANSKNCYLVFWNVNNEDCYYGHIVWKSKQCFDCLYTYQSELCYFCVDCIDCYDVFYSIDTEKCSNWRFLINCKNCKDCFWCVWLINKQFYIFNKQYSENNYMKKIKEFDLWNYQVVKKIKEEVGKLKKNNIVKCYHWFNCDNVSWDYLYYSKNVFDSFDIKNCENVKHCSTVWDFKDSMDCNFSARKWELLYEVLTCYGYNIAFSHNCTNNWSNLYYCDNCYSCHYCFWSVWLKNKKYCILNKQYTKEQYESLIPEIIKHMEKFWEWGEFFSYELSPFAYNETIAQEYFPLNKEEVLNKWWKYKEKDDQIPNVSKIIPAEKLPDKISDIPDDVLNWAIKCEISKRPFKLIPQELAFYRKHNIPIPHLHHEQRHKQRMKLRNPRKLFDRKCMKCERQIQTTYSLDRSEIVYCEECYLKNVY